MMIGKELRTKYRPAKARGLRGVSHARRDAGGEGLSFSTCRAPRMTWMLQEDLICANHVAELCQGGAAV